MHAPDDVVGISPKRPNGVNHDLGLGDNDFDRCVVRNIYNENSNFITKAELSPDLF